MEMSYMRDGRNFYMRHIASADAEKIDEAMEMFDPEAADQMEFPIKSGTLCAA